MKKKILFAAIVCSLLVACASPTQIINTWRDPTVTINPRLHKIVVAALLHDQGVRRQVEDYMSSLYPGTATQSYLIFGDSLINDTNGETQKLRDLGFDGIVVMKQVGMDATKYYVPGTMPGFYSTWGGYWGYGWNNVGYYPGSPGYVKTDRTWRVQVNAYSLISNKLVFSANTATTDPGGRIPLFMDVCDAVRAEMKREKFIKK
jgi:hypothetical protein